MFDPFGKRPELVLRPKHLTRRVLDERIAEGESTTLEFKRHFSSPDRMAKEIIAFANTKGGMILMGVDDDGSVVGVESEKSEMAEIEHTAQFLCEPPIPVEIQVVHFGGSTEVVAVIIPESTNKPHTLVEFDSSGKRVQNPQAQGYVRVKDRSMQASREVMKVMKSRRPDAPPLRIAIGYNERALFDYLEKHGRITVDEFANLVNISRRRASKIVVDLVRAGTLLIHTVETTEFFTLSE
ncbi:MAG: putative DNA binding domain-containing protein [Bacteroidetes bacterium]|nr:putative DNA binding domain-containing protein [Bacteroidota bacterium]